MRASGGLAGSAESSIGDISFTGAGDIPGDDIDRCVHAVGAQSRRTREATGIDDMRMGFYLLQVTGARVAAVARVFGL